jgi:hypothetical protein
MTAFAFQRTITRRSWHTIHALTGTGSEVHRALGPSQVARENRLRPVSDGMVEEWHPSC